MAQSYDDRLCLRFNVMYIYSHMHMQGWRMPCNSEGAQALGMRTISNLGGSGGILPHEGLALFDPQRVLLKLSDSSAELFFIVQAIINLSPFIHL